MFILYFDDIMKMTDFRPSARPTNSYSLRSYRIGRLSIEFESKKKIMKAAGMVFQIYEEPRKSRTTVWELQNAEKKSGGEVGNVEI